MKFLTRIFPYSLFGLSAIAIGYLCFDIYRMTTFKNELVKVQEEQKQTTFAKIPDFMLESPDKVKRLKNLPPGEKRWARCKWLYVDLDGSAWLSPDERLYKIGDDDNYFPSRIVVHKNNEGNVFIEIHGDYKFSKSNIDFKKIMTPVFHITVVK
ncbi:hypothetical protein C4577_06495 [Candidatus Parcubacteria bacterium]|nr:MAG: hypothetical protein C4577_06495 [Candidatus Parcubacteria bacterium]